MDIDWSTWGPTGAAVVAAGVAVWQAFSARSQAKSARDSADTAERQAKAAEDHLALARRQFDADLAARDEAEGPQFQVGPGVAHLLHEMYAAVPIKLLSGKHLDTVVISTPGVTDVRGFVRKVGDDDEEVVPAKTFKDLAPGAAFAVYLMLEFNAGTPLNVRFDLECYEGGGSRTWRRTYSAEVSEPPDPPAPSGRRRPSASS